MDKQTCLFPERFLEKFVGKYILTDWRVAIFELIANSWDSGATKIEIDWSEEFIKIKDNGAGMSKDEFLYRWRTLAYERTKHQGIYAENINGITKRKAFGKNGIGRFAAFCFASQYFVTTTRNGDKIKFQVNESSGDSPFEIKNVSEEKSNDSSGTIIETSGNKIQNINEDVIMSEIGMRFLSDPRFSIFVNGKLVEFNQIPTQNIEETFVTVNGSSIPVFIIDVGQSDRTTKQHGLAWHVNGRLVGNCTWKGWGIDDFIDGRKTEAKRFLFIIKADVLENSVNKDWTGFLETDQEFEPFKNAILNLVKERFINATKERRQEITEKIKKNHRQSIKSLTPIKKEKWEAFVEKIQIDCPSLNENEVEKVSEILINLESSESKFGLIEELHKLKPDQLDDLHDILVKWTIDMAKEVLGELEIRLKLLDELLAKINDLSTDEVHELQPLFHRGLWIFGPEFETIEFTSNQSMGTVIQKLFDKKENASRNRPDFVVLPDSSVGLYSYPSYDEEGGEIGIEKLIVVELKKPGIRIGSDQKQQCWKYVKELYSKSLLQEFSKVSCFVLGSDLDTYEKSTLKEMQDKVLIIPLTYETVIARAKSRLLKLYDKVKSAPFLKASREPQIEMELKNV